MDYIEIDDFLTYFYRSPAPEKAASVLGWLLRRPEVQDPCSWVPTEYFFARLAQEYPSLASEFEPVLHDGPNKAGQFTSSLRRHLRSSQRQPVGRLPVIGDLKSVLNRPIRTATDNDLLWAEFVLTGSTEPIVRLIDVLERPDRVRAGLEKCLSGVSVWKVAKLRHIAGIEVNLDQRTIDTPGDLDCLCLMEGVDLTPRFSKVLQALPFVLASDDVMEMGVKATAKWSLASNANRHPQVLATCEKELARRTGKAGLALRDIVDYARSNADDYAKALELRRAADEGDAEAQRRLGQLYEDGKGVHQSDELAAAWYTRASEQGHASAQSSLATMYHNGQGVRQDQAEALRWYRKAAAQGDAQAQFGIGHIYDYGLTGPQDSAKAKEWYRKAAAQGHKTAQFRLKAIGLRKAIFTMWAAIEGRPALATLYLAGFILLVALVGYAGVLLWRTFADTPFTPLLLAAGFVLVVAWIWQRRATPTVDLNTGVQFPSNYWGYVLLTTIFAGLIFFAFFTLRTVLSALW